MAFDGGGGARSNWHLPVILVSFLIICYSALGICGIVYDAYADRAPSGGGVLGAGEQGLRMRGGLPPEPSPSVHTRTPSPSVTSSPTRKRGVLLAAAGWSTDDSVKQLGRAAKVLDSLRKATAGQKPMEVVVLVSAPAEQAAAALPGVRLVSVPMNTKAGAAVLEWASFDDTLVLDTQTSVCLDPAPLFEALDMGGTWDMVVDTSSLTFDGDAELGAYTVRKGAGLDALRADWLEASKTTALASPAKSLLHLLRANRPGAAWRLGVQGMVTQGQWHRWSKDSKIIHTVVLKTPMVTYPGDGDMDPKTLNSLCVWFNYGPYNARLVTLNEVGWEFKLLKAPEEACNVLGQEGCDHPDFDWINYPAPIQSAAQFLRLPAPGSA